MDSDKGQILIKILSIGDSQVGKSCLIKRFCEGRFISRYITTIGVDYGVKKMQINNKKIAINFFDLSGDEDYTQISSQFLGDAQGVLLVFDLTNKESFNNIVKWEKKLKAANGENTFLQVFLVGNKSDLKAKIQVGQPEIQKFTQKKGYPYFQTSANSGEQVNELFEQMFKLVITNIESNYGQLIK